MCGVIQPGDCCWRPLGPPEPRTHPDDMPDWLKTMFDQPEPEYVGRHRPETS